MSNTVPVRNNPFLEKAVVALWFTEDACADFLEDHEDVEGEACDCFQCEDVHGVLWMVRHFEALLTSQMYGMPPKLRRLRALEFPGADQLADMMLSLDQGADGPDLE